MPTYVYECSKCNTQFEALQRMIEEPLDTCPCGSTGTVKRLIQPIAVMFKGSGFHINDYAAKGGSSEKTETPATAPEDGPIPAPAVAAAEPSPAPSTPESSANT